MKDFAVFSYFFIILFTVSFQILPPESRIFTPDVSDLKLSFGSCFGLFNKSTDIFKNIKAYNPYMWIWLGDYAYTDKFSPFGWSPNPIEKVIYQYNRTYTQKYYQSLEKEHYIIGVWDDHDYGLNNANKYFTGGKAVKPVFLDFIGERENTERRKREGVYEDYQIKLKNLSIRLILLDVRSFKESLLWDKDADILGEEQWEWFENIFKNTKDDIYLIGSGVQVLPFDRTLIVEHWFRKPRTRLIQLIKKYQKSGVIILSGDVHFAQLYKTNCDSEGIGYPIYEICSSGLSHFCTTHSPFCDIFCDTYTPLTYPITPIYDFFNFGTVEIDSNSNKQQTLIKLQIRDYVTNIVFEKELKLGELSFKDLEPNEGCRKHFEREWLHFFNRIIQNLLNFNILQILIILILLAIISHILWFPIWVLKLIIDKFYLKKLHIYNK